MKQIHKAFVNVCAGVENVKRDTKGQVGSQTYKYATLESVLAVVQPLLKENGLALAQYVVDDGLHAELIHESGETIAFGRYNLGGLDKHQSRGSAITYGRRYQICAIFGITQEDDDGASATIAAKKDVFKPTDGEKTAQEVYGTANAFKKAFVEVQQAIQVAGQPEDFAAIQVRIDRARTVDSQTADQLQRELDERESYIMGL